MLPKRGKLLWEHLDASAEHGRLCRARPRNLVEVREPLVITSEEYNQILRNVPLYRKAIESGMPFPKTRRIVFQENKPASLPGWALLEVV